MRRITHRHIFTGTRKIKHAKRAFHRSRAPLETRAPVMLRVLETSISGTNPARAAWRWLMVNIRTLSSQSERTFNEEVSEENHLLSLVFLLNWG